MNVRMVLDLLVPGMEQEGMPSTELFIAAVQYLMEVNQAKNRDVYTLAQTFGESRILL